MLRVALGSVTTAESGCRCISNHICWVNGHNDWKYSCIYRLLERRFLKFSKVTEWFGANYQRQLCKDGKFCRHLSLDICVGNVCGSAVPYEFHWDYVTLCQRFISSWTNHKQHKDLANHKTLTYMYVFVTLWDLNMILCTIFSDVILYAEGLVSATQAISSLDCDKSLWDLVIYLVLMWLLPMGVKGYSLTTL